MCCAQLIRWAVTLVVILSLINGSVSYRDELTEVLPFDRCVRIRAEDINFMCQPFFEEIFQEFGEYDSLNGPHHLSVLANTSFREQVQFAKLKTEGMKALGEPCRPALLHFTCAGIFKPCANVSFVNPLNNQTYYVNTTIPRAPCLDLCREVYDKCPDETLGDDFPSCNDTTDTPLGPVQNFPKRGIMLPLGLPGQNLTLIPCWHLGNQSAAIRKFPCPEPMKFNKYNPPEKAECAVPCPTPIYSQYEFDFLVISQITLVLISIPLCIFVIIPFFCAPWLRTFPKCLRGHIALAGLIALLARCYVFRKDAFCIDETTAMDQSDSICAYNYYGNNFGSLVSFYLWSALAATLAWTLWKALTSKNVHGYTYNQIKGQLFIAICWIAGAIQSALPLAFGAVVGRGYFCGASFWWNMASLIFPASGCIAITTFSAIPITYCLYKIRFGKKIERSLSELERKKWAYRIKQFTTDLRMFGFIIYLEIVAALSLATVAKYRVDEDSIGAGIAEWIQCSIAFGENCSDLRYDIGVPWTLLAAVEIISTGKGIPIIVFLGSTDEVLKFYRLWWRNGFWSVVRGTAGSSGSQDTPKRVSNAPSQAKIATSASPSGNNSKSSGSTTV